MFKRILVPLDGSRFSGRAIPYAVEISRQFDGEIILLQVIKPTPLVMPGAGADSMLNPTTSQLIVESAKEKDSNNLAQANQYLRKRSRRMIKQGIKSSYQVLLGEPAKSVIRFCKKESIDLVVMTTRGKSGLKRAFMGSVADEIIREPGIPVLAIRPKSNKKAKK